MIHRNILVVSDNQVMLEFFTEMLYKQPGLLQGKNIDFVCSPSNKLLANKTIGKYTVRPLNVKQDQDKIIARYDLIISIHCKQLFPEKLTRERLCVNLHPGLNPYNRGWFPQVFSILNGLPLGATLHEIDEEIDHGSIIAQKEVPLHSWDTSKTAYDRVQDAEKQILKENIAAVLEGNYTARLPEKEGNVNLKKDFENLQEINRDEFVTFGEAIDRLRALTHAPYKNAYFIDKNTGERVWLSIDLEKEASVDG